MVNVMASTRRSHIILPAALLSAKDTIIKMDSVRDKKLYRTNKAAAPSKKGLSNTAYSKSDTIKKPKEQPLTHATAVDSSYFDQDNKIYYLWGRAHVEYEDFELEADYIRVDQKNHLIFARGSIDPKTKRYVGRPVAKSKNEKPVASDSLLFDYNTKKGKTWNPATEQEGNFISGGQAKRINGDEV